MSQLEEISWENPAMQEENQMKAHLTYESCTLCPRMCGTNRLVAAGYCGCTSQMKAARAALHMWEEPCISGTNGSGTIFFSGCTLKCCFCQNYSISSDGFGAEISVKRLSHIFLELQEKGAHNINLVTATQYLPSVLEALDLARSFLSIPVVFNCSGYERVEVIEALKGYVDIFLPDMKYYSSNLSKRYSKAPDYFNAASRAILQMIKQTGTPSFDNNGLMTKGVIIRHMVMPSHRDDSILLLHWMKEQLPENQYQISLLSQYTPFYQSQSYPEINRRITSYEYNKVVDCAIELGLVNGYMQKRSSAKEEYTPPFDLEGI